MLNVLAVDKHKCQWRFMDINFTKFIVSTLYHVDYGIDKWNNEKKNVLPVGGNLLRNW